jgi:transcriptional regulator with XRE-family HTH domain
MEASWFAGRLWELREGKSLSREELAALAGIKPSAVRDVEQAVYSPNWETVIALCKALGVTADAFLEKPAQRPRRGRGRPRKATDGEHRGQEGRRQAGKPEGSRRRK